MPLSHRRNRVFVIGYPGDIGGAGTECWHTVKLWRRHGLDVTLVPTWKATDTWRERLDAIGCRTIETHPYGLDDVPGLAGGVAVSFCNAEFLRCAGRLQRLGCRVVWLNCMTWLSAGERAHYRHHRPFDAYVFQSRHQRRQLFPELLDRGVRLGQCHLIHGAFCWDEFPFSPRPHPPGSPLVIGRLSRADPDKYAANTWDVYRGIKPPIRARLLGWDGRIEAKLGPPPDWAECLPPGGEKSAEFLGSLHCMIQINGGAEENWPRSGLEAMARGVPIIAENRWGWREMIRHGQTGYLAEGPETVVRHAERLAQDEPLRLAIALRARCVLENKLAEPGMIWARWRRVFAELGIR